jgi:hypothetical protein
MTTTEIVSIVLNIGLLIIGSIVLTKYKMLQSENDSLTDDHIQNNIEFKRLRNSIEFEKNIADGQRKISREYEKENAKLKQDLKWYEVRMDLKRKHK